MTGVSIALNAPRVGGPLAGYPYDDEATERMLRSRSRRLFQLAPGRVRQRMIERLPREQTAAAVFARHAVGRAHRGAPSRDGVEGRRARRAGRRARDRHPADDAVHAARAAEPGHGGVPRARARAAPVAERAADRAGRHGDPRAPASSGASRTRRRRRTARSSSTRAPRATATRCARPSARRSPTRRRSPTTAPGGRAIRCSRSSSGARATRPAHRLGAVLIAGCRDAQSARQLGFVPVHGLGAALDMARGRGAQRFGYLVAPPYFPLVVSGTCPRSRRGRSCGPARSSSARPRCRRARCGPVSST